MTPFQIRALRKKLGLSGAQMAQMLGFSNPRSYRSLEMPADAQTHRAPTPSVMRLLQAYEDGYRPADWPEEGKGAMLSPKKRKLMRERHNEAVARNREEAAT